MAKKLLIESSVDQVNGRKRAVLSVPADLVAEGASERLCSEVVRCALVKRVIGGEGEVGRVVVVPHRHIANIVTR